MYRLVGQDLARGLATIIPLATLSIFSWKELQVMVCGHATVDMSLLASKTIYGDGCSETDVHIRYFWHALRSFSDSQKSLFLRFVWGRSRLPPTAAEFTQDFKISGLAKAAANPDAYLPIAHTCFFSIDIPRYTTQDVMTERLLYAITNCQAIDTDNTSVAQQSGHQGAIWNASGSSSSTSGESSSLTTTVGATDI